MTIHVFYNQPIPKLTSTIIMTIHVFYNQPIPKLTSTINQIELYNTTNNLCNGDSRVSFNLKICR